MTKIRSGDVTVEGLTELNRALRAIGKEAQGDLKAVSRGVADLASRDAAGIAHGLGGVAAKVAPSIRGVGGVAGAGVAFGGAAYPFAAGAEFGSSKYKQFKPWRGSGSDAGYFVYESIRQNSERIEEEYVDAINDLMKRNGLL